MQLSLSTGCLYLMPLRIACSRAAEAGFDAIELVMAPEVWLRGADWARRIADDHGLAIATVHQSILGRSPEGDGPRRAIDAARFARELDVPTVVIHGTFAHTWDDVKAIEWLAALEEAQDILNSSGTRLALENHGLRVPSDGDGVLASIEQLVAFCRDRDLDITFDTCHAGSFSLSLTETLDAVAPRLADVHLCDIVSCTRGPRSATWRYSASQHRIPGQGQLDLGSFLMRLGQIGYGGPITVEVTPFALRVWSRRYTAQKLHQIAQFVRRHTDIVAPVAVASPEPTSVR